MYMHVESVVEYVMTGTIRYVLGQLIIRVKPIKLNTAATLDTTTSSCQEQDEEERPHQRCEGDQQAAGSTTERRPSWCF